MPLFVFFIIGVLISYLCGFYITFGACGGSTNQSWFLLMFALFVCLGSSIFFYLRKLKPMYILFFVILSIMAHVFGLGYGWASYIEGSDTEFLESFMDGVSGRVC